ncbi:MAG TPA: hypothetical protein VI875_04630, partial [Candidatus Norongarragalinales archaeon]|nr:hypothetical protein [Candidatus Norongarragalinales archaeon]
MEKRDELAILISLFVLAVPLAFAFGGGGGSGGSGGGGGGGGDVFITPSPTVTQTPLCEQTTLQERVRCRLSVEVGDTLPYVPEACRLLAGGERISCIAKYNLIQPCRRLETDETRVACVKQKLELRSIGEEKTPYCLKNAACRERLKQKVFNTVEFRIYNLEERAEAYMQTHESSVVDFIAKMEEKKQEFKTQG